MQPGVVAQIHRRIAEVAGQRRAVIVPLAVPVPVVQRQAMHQHGQPTARPGNASREALGFQWQELPVMAQAHRNRQWIARRREVVAQDAVQRRAHRLALARRTRLAERAIERRQKGAHSPSRQPDRASHAAVDQPRDAARRFSRWRPEKARRASNVVVHGFHHADQPRGGVERQHAVSAKFRRRNSNRVGHWTSPCLNSARVRRSVRQNQATFPPSTIASLTRDAI